MTQSEKVTVSDLLRVAELSNLELTRAEESSMLRDLNSILEHFAQLSELDTADVPAMAQVSEVLGIASAALRPDEVAPSLPREPVLASAPDSDRVFFRVPKVIER